MISNKEAFDEFLLESFKDGRSVRELRLSEEEADYIKVKLPKAKFKKLSGTDLHAIKKWYEVDTNRD
ncbi:hypothetical protein [Ornithinibacillus bavariensis]|uniref:Uncharacterized protein n=1 Tax=Ornithinibacillus bavariensis TaxID=545502 RepID=A0A919X8X0_9BACI|nr:hypothetical protein [Ornithinibacillus bavariensis]GIO26685.1 hypothetical protein J43TS3_12960 [Ornithinibacillus bavariensis]HAM80866.1 hypothetical protein [Ornithinibacillus sp.]